MNPRKDKDRMFHVIKESQKIEEHYKRNQTRIDGIRLSANTYANIIYHTHIYQFYVGRRFGLMFDESMPYDYLQFIYKKEGDKNGQEY